MGDKLNIGNLLPTSGAMPLLTRERFATLVGVSHDTVNKWVDRGYIPVVSVGRWSLVNVALLSARCLEKEFNPLSNDSTVPLVLPVTTTSKQRVSARKAAVAG